MSVCILTTNVTASCAGASSVSADCVNTTNASVSCIIPIVVPPVVVLLPEMHVYDSEDNEVTLDAALVLPVGINTFRIVNTGPGTLTIGTITSDDLLFVVTQPEQTSIETDEETTFTIEVLEE